MKTRSGRAERERKREPFPVEELLVHLDTELNIFYNMI
jgi:hypothetical protein